MLLGNVGQIKELRESPYHRHDQVIRQLAQAFFQRPGRRLVPRPGILCQAADLLNGFVDMRAGLLVNGTAEESPQLADILAQWRVAAIFTHSCGPPGQQKVRAAKAPAGLPLNESF